MEHTAEGVEEVARAADTEEVDTVVALDHIAVAFARFLVLGKEDEHTPVAAEKDHYNDATQSGHNCSVHPAAIGTCHQVVDCFFVQDAEVAVQIEVQQ